MYNYRTRYFLLLASGILWISLQATFATTSPLKWTAKELVGRILTLKDDVEIQSFRFISDGAVAASTGTNSKNGGVAYPVFYWMIDKQGVLHIYTHPEHPENALFRITKLKVRKNRIIADCNGEERIYTLVKDN